jgi:hypothetical protein
MSRAQNPRCRHAHIHLPPLDAACALTIVDLLQRAILAIRLAHGDRMDDLAAMRAAACRRRSCEYVDDGNPDAPDDTEF